MRVLVASAGEPTRFQVWVPDEVRAALGVLAAVTIARSLWSCSTSCAAR
ncbi:MAG: hypothetical protein ACXV5Q_02505 [Frankiaceae bacterium]